MKFNPTWPQVALLLGLVAAIIVSHAVAPPVVGAVTSIVSTLIGSLVVDLKRKEDAKPAPVLSLVKGDDNKEDAS